MLLQQPELPKDQPATEAEQYGFSFIDFINDNIWYLLILAFVVALVVFDYYRRKNRRK